MRANDWVEELMEAVLPFTTKGFDLIIKYWWQFGLFVIGAIFLSLMSLMGIRFM